MPRSRVPVRGSIGKSIITGKSSTTVNNTTVVQNTTRTTGGVSGVSSTIWPLIAQIPLPVLDLAALTTPGIAVFDGTNLIVRTLVAASSDVVVGNGTGAAGNPSVDISAAVKASLALADTSVQPARTLTAGTGLTGGGNLSADRTIALNSTSIASLAKADTAVQPGSLAAIATSGSASDLITGTVPAATLPVATTSTLGAVKVDGTSITITSGVISAAGGGSSPLTTKGDLYGFNTANARIGVGTDGTVLTADSTNALGVSWQAIGGTGTVTSVAMTVPSALLSVTGSPITGSGTLAVALPTRAANLIFAGPSSGSAATPTFRALVAADIPALPSGANPTAHVGPTAVNGTATTFMRSDGAPAIDLTANYAWTGTAGWTGGLVRSSSTSQVSVGLDGGFPAIAFSYSAAGTDAKIWEIVAVTGGSLIGQTVNDAITAGKQFLEVTRNGYAITSVRFGNTFDFPAVDINALKVYGYDLPASLPDLIYWFCADQINGSNGAPVQMMPNAAQPYTSRVFIPASGASPGCTLAVPGQNSLPVVATPGGSSGRMNLTNNGILLKKSTVFYVLYMSGTGGSLFNGDSGCYGNQQNTGGAITITENFIALLATASSGVLNAWHQINASYDDSSGAYAFRLGSAANGSGTASGSISGLTHGMFYNPGNGSEDWSGYVAEHIVYNRVLTTTEKQLVEAYLAAKWGVT